MNTTEPSLYQLLTGAGCEIGHHYSDLYVKSTPEADAIVRKWMKDKGFDRGGMSSRFTSQIDRAIWWNMPLMFDPYWDARETKHTPGPTFTLDLAKPQEATK